MNKDLDLKLYTDLANSLKKYRMSQIYNYSNKEYRKLIKQDNDLLERLAKRLGIITLLSFLKK